MKNEKLGIKTILRIKMSRYTVNFFSAFYKCCKNVEIHCNSTLQIFLLLFLGAQLPKLYLFYNVGTSVASSVNMVTVQFKVKIK